MPADPGGDCGRSAPHPIFGRVLGYAGLCRGAWSASGTRSEWPSVNMGHAKVLVLAPVGRDGPAAAEIFARIGVQATVCTDYEMLVDQLGPHCLTIVATEEGLRSEEHTSELQSLMRT